MEGVHNGDRFRCNVGSSGIGLRYLKARTTLYIRFHYERWMCKIGKWIPLQSFEEIFCFDVVVNMPNGVAETVQVSKHWTLRNLREHLIIMGMEDAHTGKFQLHRHKVG